jgi:hypothetical protein
MLLLLPVILPGGSDCGVCQRQVIPSITGSHASVFASRSKNIKEKSLNWEPDIKKDKSSLGKNGTGTFYSCRSFIPFFFFFVREDVIRLY